MQTRVSKKQTKNTEIGGIKKATWVKNRKKRDYEQKQRPNNDESHLTV